MQSAHMACEKWMFALKQQQWLLKVGVFMCQVPTLTSQMFLCNKPCVRSGYCRWPPLMSDIFGVSLLGPVRRGSSSLSNFWLKTNKHIKVFFFQNLYYYFKYFIKCLSLAMLAACSRDGNLSEQLLDGSQRFGSQWLSLDATMMLTFVVLNEKY